MSGGASWDLKLDRAREHLKTLRDEMAVFADQQPHGVREQINDTRTQRTIYFVENMSIPERWGVLIGDCVHDFRCVLDHLVFALPRTPGTDPRWRDWSQFPICDDPTWFANRNHDVVGIDPAVLAVIESLQPYSGGNDPVGHPLRYLRQLSNLDKHRLVHGAWLLLTRVAMEIPIPEVGTVHRVLAEGTLEDGAIVGKLYYSHPNPPGMEMKITLGSGVTIAEIEPTIGVQTVLNAIDGAVQNAITELALHVG